MSANDIRFLIAMLGIFIAIAGAIIVACDSRRGWFLVAIGVAIYVGAVGG